MLSIYILYFAIFLVSGVLLISGTRKRQHGKLMPFMIMLIIGVFVSFLNMLSMGLIGLFLAFFWIAIDVYLFFVVYSLYDMFRNEKNGTAGHVGSPPAYAYPQQTVIYTQQPVGFVQEPVVQYHQSELYQQPQTTFHMQQEQIGSSENPNAYGNKTQPMETKVPLD